VGTLSCPRCGRELAGDDISVERRLAVCRPCGELMVLPEAIETFAPADAKALARLRPSGDALIERAVGRKRRFVARGSHLETGPLAGGVAFALWAVNHPIAWVVALAAVAVAGSLGLNGFLMSRARPRFDLGPDELVVGHALRPRAFVERTAEIVRFDVTSAAAAWYPSGRWAISLRTRDDRVWTLPFALRSQDLAHHLAHRLNRALDELRAPETYRG
jgi:hypothetical protein